MSIIRTTVNDVIRSRHGNTGSLGAYQSTVDEVVRALENGLSNVVQTLRSEGQALGASRAQIDQILEQAGLIEPAPQVSQNGQADEGMEARMARVEESLASLTRIAESAQRRGLI